MTAQARLFLTVIAVAAMVISAGVSNVRAQTPAAGPGQAYPSRPVKIIIPLTAGGGADVVARILAQKLDHDQPCRPQRSSTRSACPQSRARRRARSHRSGQA